MKTPKIDTFGRFKMLGDFSNPGYDYIGLAPHGTKEHEPRWRIARVAKDFEGQSNVELLFHSGDEDDFSAVWDDRLSLTYD